MSVKKLVFLGTYDAVATGTVLSSTPVMERDASGQRTNQQACDEKGRALWRVEGLSPLLQGTLMEGGTVILTQKMDMACQFGQRVRVNGKIELRPVFNGYGIVAKLIGEKDDNGK